MRISSSQCRVPPASGPLSSPVISSRNPAIRQSIRIPMWRRGPTRSTVFLRLADPMPSTYRGTAASLARNSFAINKIGSDGTAQSRDDIVEHRDGELSQRRVDLAEAALKRGIDRRRVAAEECLVDVVAGELRRLDQAAEVDEQIGRQAR